nr:hypothetical protein [Actinomycetales bacterium]
MAPSAIESLDEPDLVARQFTWLTGATTAAVLSAGVIVTFSGRPFFGIPLILAAIPLYLATRRLGAGVPTTVRLDPQGIQRLGSYPWSLGWDELEYAAIHPYDATQVLVAIPKEPVKHWSRTWRMKEQVLIEDLGLLPEGGYVAPVFDELAWDMEYFISGHLPGHPGFDPSRLRLPERLRRGQYDPDPSEPASPGRGRMGADRRAAQQRGPMATSTPDPLPRRESMIYLVLGMFAMVFAVLAWLMLKSIGGAVALALAAAFLIYRANLSHAARDSIVLINHDGIRRAGPWGWQQQWKQIASARVEEFRGNHYLVLVRKDENAPYHRSATSLAGHPFPGNALVTPIPSEQIDDVEAALRTWGRR